MRLRQVALWTIRGFLSLVLIYDAWLVGGVAFHAFKGGRNGVRQWIGHLANLGGPAVWREHGDPLEIAVRSVQSAYENFIAMCLILVAATALLFWGQKRLVVRSDSDKPQN